MELACRCLQTALPLTMQGVKQCCHSGVAATRPPRLGTKLMLRDSSGPSLSLSGTGMPYNTISIALAPAVWPSMAWSPIIAALAQGPQSASCVVVAVPPRARRGRRHLPHCTTFTCQSHTLTVYLRAASRFCPHVGSQCVV